MDKNWRRYNIFISSMETRFICVLNLSLFTTYFSI